METIGTMGKKLKTAGILVNRYSSPALLLLYVGQVLSKVKQTDLSTLMMPRRGRLLNDSWRRFVHHTLESNQVLTTDCGGNGEFLRLNNLFTKATDFRVM